MSTDIGQLVDEGDSLCNNNDKSLAAKNLCRLHLLELRSTNGACRFGSMYAQVLHPFL